MPEFALQSLEISKKFKKGESFDSLKDLVPAMIGRAWKNTRDPNLNAAEFWALKDISFQVKPGEALGIIGHNGAGKSTLLKILSGIIKPTRGSLIVNGKLSALIEVGAGFHPDLTGRENIYLNGVIMGMPRKEIRQKFDEIVQFAGIEAFIDTPIKRYSSGMYARLGFSVAAHVSPEILLVDEVLSVGDWAYQQKCAQKMKELIHGGAAVVFVSHNLRAIPSLCDSCILLENGAIVKRGLSEETIGYYLDSAARNSSEALHANVAISKVSVLQRGEQVLRFSSGDKLVVKILLACNVSSDDLALHVYVVDSNYYEVFETSTELLGEGVFSLRKGESREFAFELTVHLGRGMYYLGTVVRSNLDSARQHDRKFPAATFYVDGSIGVRGSANLYPVVV